MVFSSVAGYEGVVVLGGQRPACRTGVDDPSRLDQQRVHLDLSTRAVLDAAGDDEQLAGAKRDITIAQLNRQASIDDEE